MTAVDYKPFVERMIERYEGGYGWDKNDPGGPTRYGITCYDLAEHRRQKMDSMRRWAPIVQKMTIDEADDIYATKYATACQFNKLNTGADCVVFDFGVNSGPSRAVKTAQKFLGVAVDGVLGPITLEAINSMDTPKFIATLCAARMKFLQALSIWSTFGRGWTARVTDLQGYSLRLLHPKTLAGVLGSHQKLTRIPLAFAKGWI